MSVIIPNYNGGNFIPECLQSVVNQLHKELEIIIVDDGSTDGSVAEIEKFVDSRIRLFHSERKGACFARNLGVSKANGDYFQFLDSDDFISPNKISAQLNKLRGFDEHVGICRSKFFYDGEDPDAAQFEDEWFLYDSDTPVDFLLRLYGLGGKWGMIQTNVWLVPRSIIEAIGPWNEGLLQDQDGEYFCRVVLQSKGIRYAPEAINYYRKFKERKSVSRTRNEDYYGSALAALKLKADYVLRNRPDESARQTMALQFKVLAVRFYPEFPVLSNEALSHCQRLGGTGHVPVIGGRYAEFLKAVIGWRLAKFVMGLVTRLKAVL